MLIAAVVALVIALVGGVFWYKQRQKKNFIVATGCVIVLLPFISLIAGICSIIMFLHWVICR
jgi:uncharacterized membrane protein YjjP (DUF1212 family)